MAKRIEARVEPVPRKWLSRMEAKNLLGCSDKFLQTLRDEGQVRFAKYRNKMYWYDLQSVERFLERNRVN